MQQMTINEIINAVKGTLINSVNDQIIEGISIDSRKVKKGDLFIPIKGERFDGHDFIDSAVENGALVCISDNREKINCNVNMILVEDVLKALHDLALYYRKKFDIPFIAITGSSGKTTTKDMIASVLEQKYQVLKTQGNYNNEIGLPLTLFQLESHHEVAVIEMGMSSLGEISKLVHMVYPDIAVITNIGLTHIENLGSQEMIFEAKKEILETLTEGQIALLNGDDTYLSTVGSEKFTVSFVGVEGENLTLKASDIINEENGISFSLKNREKRIEKFKLNLPGVHNIYNSLAAIYIGKHYNLTQIEIQRGLNQFRPSKMRMDISDVGQIKIINDVYNANPDAMKAALQVLKDSGKDRRKIAVLGDMLEMGEWSENAHFEIGKFVSELDIDLLLAVGQYADYYIKGAQKGGMTDDKALAFRTNGEAIQHIKHLIQDKDVFLIKGSRGVKMEQIVTFLQERS